MKRYVQPSNDLPEKRELFVTKFTIILPPDLRFFMHAKPLFVYI